MAKFKRGDRIYPNLEAMNASMPYGHNWHIRPNNQASLCPRYVNAVRADGLYLLADKAGRRGTLHGHEWVEKHFFSEAEYIEHLMGLACANDTFPAVIDARNALMELGDRLTVEVSAIRGNDRESAFEELLNAWKKYGYRPTLSVKNPSAKALAGLYDFTQKMRGSDVQAFRSNG